MNRSPSNSGPRRRATRSLLSLLAAPAFLVAALDGSTEARAANAPSPQTLGLSAPGAVSSIVPVWSVLPGTAPNRIDGLTIEELDDGTTTLRVQGSAKPTFNVYRLGDPDRLVLDLAGSERGKVVPHVPLDTWACGRVTVDAVRERDADLVRVVVELKRDASYVVIPKDDQLVVTITPREVAPEAYFARRSAQERRKDLEARSEQIERERKAASAMAMETKALNSQARQQAQLAKKEAAAAKKKAADAKARVATAKKAEAAAMAAEKRANDSAAQAAATLADAKGHRFRAKRALKKAREAAEQAAVERKAAAVQRKQAEAVRSAAQGKLKIALAKVQAERSQLASARKEAERAKLEATAAKTRATKAEKEAKAAQAAAQKKLATAQAELLEAQADRKAAKQASSERLLAAERAAKKASRAAENAAKADREAKKRLQAAAKEAERKLAEAKAAAKSVESVSASKLAAAQDAEARARKTVEQAKVRAKAEAAKVVAQAKKEAAATRSAAAAEAAATKSAAAAAAAKTKSAAVAAAAKTKSEAAKAKSEAAKTKSEAARAQSEAAKTKSEAAKTKSEAAKAKSAAQRMYTDAAALRSQAKQALSQANAAVSAAEADKKAAIKARKKAESELASAKAAAAKAKGKAAAAKVADAEKASMQAAAKAAQAKLGAAQQARKEAATRQAQAEKSLVSLRRDRDSLEAKLSEQKKKAASLDKAIATRSKELQALEAKVAAAKAKHTAKESKALKSARSQLAKTRATATVLDKEVARLVNESQEARKRAAAAEAKVAELERSGAAHKKLAQARAAASTATAQAQQAKTDLAARSTKLAKLSKTLDARQAKVSKLAAEEKALDAKNQAKKSELAKAEAELDAVHEKLAAEKAELAEITQGLADAKTTLEDRVAESTPPSGARIEDVRFEHGKTEQRVVVRFEGPIEFEGTTLTPTISMLAFKDAVLAKKLERSLDASAYGGTVKSITSFAEGDQTKVLVSTHGPSAPRVERREGELVWHFPTTAMAKAPPKSTSKSKSKSAPAAAPRPEAVSLAGSKVAGYAGAPPPPAAYAAPAFEPTPGSIDEGRSPAISGRRRWRGERIDIELQDAPIKDVLLLFSDIGRVNIIAGKGVEGNVTMKLQGVPWNQALDIILRSLELGSVREGNVIRVATQTALNEERRQAIERANARVLAEPLETHLVQVSYASVDDMINKVQSVLSPRGSVTPDQRTNQLIIMDVADNVALAQDLVASLDTQTPQVLIEARIVEARTSFTRNLGIQWGFDYTASAGTGNPTGLLFPNSVGVGGGATGQPADVRGLVLPGAAANPNYAVDLPSPVGTGQGGAVGFSFGSISGNLNTNIRLSAAESTGEVRIISAPKVVTLDNSEASIEQGVQIPISQVSAQGVNTRFVNAALSLRVTPHVTNEGSVLLDVQVQKNEADFVNTGARGDPTILTKQAQSRMLVNDSDTAVIGGIYTRNKAVNYTKVPWLADIPIVGWFFKNKSEADTRSEVLIFLTPKIVNRASSIGG